jgi:hypothetical protein
LYLCRLSCRRGKDFSRRRSKETNTGMGAQLATMSECSCARPSRQRAVQGEMWGRKDGGGYAGAALTFRPDMSWPPNQSCLGAAAGATLLSPGGRQPKSASAQRESCESVHRRPIVNFCFPIPRFSSRPSDQYCLPIFSFLINVPPCRKVFAD